MVEPCRYLAGCVALALVLFGASPASASPPELAQAAAQQKTNTQDEPFGAPYNTEGKRGGDDVPLRDYLSSRIDQLRAEMLERFESLEKRQHEIDTERDNRYGQRFAAQQEALIAALQAVKEAGANALSAAKEAVTKAEEAANKRFESVNEFRKTLADQAELFMSKDAAEPRFKSLETLAAMNSARLDAIKSTSEGASNLWGYIIGFIGVLLVIATFALNLLRSREQPVKRR